MSNINGFSTSTSVPTSRSKIDQLLDAYWAAYDSYMLKFPQGRNSDADDFARFIVDQLPK